MSRFRMIAGATLVLGCGVTACSGRTERTDAADSSAAATVTPAPTTDSAAGGVAMSETQVVEAVIAANATDSAHGVVAAAKASNAEVKGFGRMMTRDHGALNKQVTDLAGRLNVSHAGPAAPQPMMAMEGKSGADFDRAYIDSKVSTHQELLSKLDRDLIPAATNAELRTLLQQARGSVQGHLDRALQLQGTLGKAK